MSDEATGKSGKTWIYVVGFLIGLPMLYLLSVGPMVVLAERRVISNSSLDAHRPLAWLIQITGTSEPLYAYVRVWCHLTQTEVPWIFR
ncbi:MAG: hypothetical protein HZA92_03295 [Verrucomicrobia bacterium]|nr:hypothetical protein [Verrucomicrobiota bacterium]